MSGFQCWTNVRFSTLDQPYTLYFVTDVMAVTDGITIIFVDGKFSSFFYVFLDLGWIKVGFRLSPLQPEINQNTTLELRQVFNLKTDVITIIFVDSFFYVFVDLGWIKVGFRLSPLQPEINQNTTLELRQVFSLKTDVITIIFVDSFFVCLCRPWLD